MPIIYHCIIGPEKKRKISKKIIEMEKIMESVSSDYVHMESYGHSFTSTSMKWNEKEHVWPVVLFHETVQQFYCRM